MEYRPAENVDRMGGDELVGQRGHWRRVPRHGRATFSFAMAAFTVVVVLTTTGAQARRDGSTLSPCLVQIGTASGKATTWRLVLHGKVSCAQARRTFDAFRHDEDSGACGSGQICGIRQPGGWQCAFLSAVGGQGRPRPLGGLQPPGCVNRCLRRRWQREEDVNWAPPAACPRADARAPSGPARDARHR